METKIEIHKNLDTLKFSNEAHYLMCLVKNILVRVLFWGLGLIVLQASNLTRYDVEFQNCVLASSF